MDLEAKGWASPQNQNLASKWNGCVINLVRYAYRKLPNNYMLIRKLAHKILSSKDNVCADGHELIDEILEFKKHGEPKRCIKCGHTEFKERVTDTLDGRGIVLEKESHCKKCNNLSGYWAHGSWLM